MFKFNVAAVSILFIHKLYIFFSKNRSSVPLYDTEIVTKPYSTAKLDYFVMALNKHKSAIFKAQLLCFILYFITASTLFSWGGIVLLMAYLIGVIRNNHIANKQSELGLSGLLY